MYQNPYMNYQQNFNSQSMNERIDNQIAQLQQMKEQMKNQQPTSINQTFQLAPTHQGGMRYANTIDDVGKEVVYADMPFFSKDMSVVWIKNNKGDIKTYELKEIIPMDDKDLQIQYLQSQIEELKGMIKNESNANNTNDDAKQNAADTTTNDGAARTTTKKSKPTSI